MELYFPGSRKNKMLLTEVRSKIERRRGKETEEEKWLIHKQNRTTEKNSREGLKERKKERRAKKFFFCLYIHRNQSIPAWNFTYYSP